MGRLSLRYQRVQATLQRNTNDNHGSADRSHYRGAWKISPQQLHYLETIGKVSPLLVKEKHA